jgi:hypothetical protein
LRRLVKYGAEEGGADKFTAETARAWLWEALKEQGIEEIH